MTLENLLNTLIKKGWKPFWDEHIHWAIKAMYYVRFLRGRENSDREIYLRQIVSKESWLWQFVCENNLVDYDTESWWGEFSYNSNYIDWFYWDRIMENDYKYRLIESALKNESELEEFLLQNIKVEWH